MANEIDLREFGEKVESLCGFLLRNPEGLNEKDKRVLHKLKEDAADIQVGRRIQGNFISLDGLSDYMSGILDQRKEKQ